MASKKRVMTFDTSDEFFRYAVDHPEAWGISPGGAAARLNVSRSRVSQLVNNGRLRAWYVYDREVGIRSLLARPSFVLISVEDVEAFRNSPKSIGGRPRGDQREVARG